MQKLKHVCGDKGCVWFEIEPKDSKEFLKWAKDLGCVWVNGEEIDPCEGVGFFHFSISSDGKLGIVPIFAWVSKDSKFKDIKRYVGKGTKQKLPNSY